MPPRLRSPSSNCPRAALWCERETHHPQPYTLHPIPCTSHPAPYTLNPTPYTLHPTPYTLHPAPCTLHPAPYTLHPTPFISYPKACTLNTGDARLRVIAKNGRELQGHRERSGFSPWTLSSECGAFRPSRSVHNTHRFMHSTHPRVHIPHEVCLTLTHVCPTQINNVSVYMQTKPPVLHVPHEVCTTYTDRHRSVHIPHEVCLTRVQHRSTTCRCTCRPSRQWSRRARSPN